MLNRRRFLGTLSASLLAVPVAVEAQRTGKAPRNAFLAGGSRSGDGLLMETFCRRKGHGPGADWRFLNELKKELKG